MPCLLLCHKMFNHGCGRWLCNLGICAKMVREYDQLIIDILRQILWNQKKSVICGTNQKYKCIAVI